MVPSLMTIPAESSEETKKDRPRSAHGLGANRSINNSRLNEVGPCHTASNIWPLVLLHVVAEQEVLVAKVKFASGNDWMGPTVLGAAIRLVKAAFLLVGSRGSFDEHHGSFTAFAAQVE